MSGNMEIETIETLSDIDDEPELLVEESDNANSDGIIEEREGIPYVSEDVLSPSPAASINQNFKDLVDSVIVTSNKNPNLPD
jgi:hypothetical protein